MAKEIITIEIDTGKSEQNLASLRKKLQEQSAALELATAGSDGFRKLQESIKATESEINHLEKGIEQYRAEDQLWEQQTRNNAIAIVDLGMKIVTLRNENTNLKDQQKELNEIYKAGGMTWEQYSTALAENESQLKTNQLAIAKLNSEQKNLIKENEAVPTSLEQMRSSLSRLTREYDQLQTAEDRNSESGKRLQREILSLTEALKAAEADTGRNQRNVGNYDEAVKKANMSLGEMRMLLREMKNASTEGMSPAQIQAHEKAMAQLVDRYGDAQAKIKTMSTDTLPAVVNAFQMLTAAAQIAVAGMSAFGVDEEQAQKFQRTMTQLIGVSQALKTVQAGLEKRTLQVAAAKLKDAVISGAMAVKNFALAASTKIVTAAQWLWNAAMAASPITWIIAGVVAIGAAILLLTTKIEKVINVFKMLTSWIGFSAKKSEDSAKAIELENQRRTAAIEKMKAENAQRKKNIEDQEFAIELMKAEGKSADEIYKKQRELLLLKIEDIKITLKQNAVRAMMGKNAMKELEEQIKQLNDYQKQIKLLDATETTRKREEGKKRAEDAKKAKEDQLKLEEELIKKSADLAKEYFEKQIAEQKKQDEARLNQSKEYFALLKSEMELAAKNEIDLQYLKNKQLYEKGLIDLETYEATKNEIKAASLIKEIEFGNLTEQEKVAKQIELDNFLTDARMANREKEMEKFKEQLNLAIDLGQQMGEFAAEAMTDAEKGLESFLKATISMLLDQIEKTLIASIFESTAREFATSDPVSAAIKAGLKTAIIKAAFGVAKSKLKAEKGMYIGGKPHSQGGTLVEAEAGEVIINKNSAKRYLPQLSAINQAGGGVPFMQTGGMVGSQLTATNNAMIFENQLMQSELMVRAIANIRPVVSIEQISSKMVDLNKIQKVSII